MPHPGNSGAGLPVLASKNEPKKSTSTLHKSFLFYQTDELISFVINVLKAGHLGHLSLNQVWYGRRKTPRFH